MHVRGSETVAALIVTVTEEADLGPLDPSDYFVCPLRPPTQDDALALSEIMTAELDKRSLVDGQLRALKQTLGVSSAGSRPSSRWEGEGLVVVLVFWLLPFLLWCWFLVFCDHDRV